MRLRMHAITARIVIFMVGVFEESDNLTIQLKVARFASGCVANARKNNLEVYSTNNGGAEVNGVDVLQEPALH